MQNKRDTVVFNKRMLFDFARTNTDYIINNKEMVQNAVESSRVSHIKMLNECANQCIKIDNKLNVKAYVAKIQM